MQLKKLNFHLYLMSSTMGYLMLSTGCAPVAYMGAATGMTTCASEERTLKTVWTDADIKARIQVEWSHYKSDLGHQLDIVVHQGQVLLTGVVDKPQTQIEAVRLVWKVPGVKQIIDETTVGEESNFGEFAQDSWISTQLKSSILVDDKIRSLNYNVQTVSGVIYLMGIAQNKKELDQVTHYARHIDGVKKVVSHVVIKGQEKSASQMMGSKLSTSQINRPYPHQRLRTGSSQHSKIPSSNEGIVEIDHQTPIIQDDPVKVQSLEAPNTGSFFQ